MKIPVLKDGVAKKSMLLLFQQLRQQRRLTTFIEKHGINGRWLKPDEPRDINVAKFFKIMACKAHFQTDEEFIIDWNEAGKKFLQWVRGMKSLEFKV
jgi:hypothetical protein